MNITANTALAKLRRNRQERLCLHPADAWAWVVLGNLYVGPRQDLETGEKFLRKALALKTGDAWTLNSLGVLHQKRGQHREAIALFAQSIAANTELPNPWCGAAMSHAALQEPDKASDLLQRLFRTVKQDDERRRGVWNQSRELFVRVQENLARRDDSAIFKCVRDYKAQMESLSGYSVKVEEGGFKDTTGARIQMAWKHGRDHHLITTPRRIARATIAMNGAYGLFLDDLYDVAGEFVAPFRRVENFDMATRLYEHWKVRTTSVSNELGGGRVGTRR